MNTPPLLPAGSRLPALKVAATIVFLLAVTLTPADRPSWLAAEAALLAVAVVLARVPPRALLKRLLMLAPLVAAIALAAVWSNRGVGAGILALRSALCLLAVIALSRATEFGEILAVFRAARMPALLVTTLALMHRYLFVLADESRRLSRARAARTFNRRRPFAWLSAASVVGQLFVRASERAERVYDAMCARGWTT